MWIRKEGSVDSFKQYRIDEFAGVLSSKEAVPGGGGAAALTGALAASLARMVCSLTEGKKKYAAVQDDILACAKEAETLRDELLLLMDRDAEGFLPLSKAYGLPRTTPEEEAYKAEVMEKCLRDAEEVPMKIMETCADVIETAGEAAAKGSVIAVSDAGCAAALALAALKAAALNVFINTKSMKDRAYAGAENRKADELMANAEQRAECVYGDVLRRLKGE